MASKRDHGDGGIDQRGEDRWRLRWRVDGKRFAKAFHGSLGEARKELRRLLKSADDGAHVAPDKITFAAWVGQWLELKSGSITPRTLERYREQLRLHVLPTLGRRPLQQITATDLDSLYAGLRGKLAPGTVRLVSTIVAGCFGAAVFKDKLVISPAARAEPVPKSKEPVGRVLDQEQLSALLAGFRGSALYSIVAVAAWTGARRNEILALRWSDVDFAAKTLSISRALEVTAAGVRYKEPKTARGRRTIAIDDNLAALLAAERDKHLRLVAGVADGVAVDLSLVRLPDGALIFPSFAGNRVDLTKARQPSAVTGRFLDHTRRVGFPGLRFHDLRATHETMLLDAGVPVHVVAARCGHDAAVMLSVYAKRTKKADDSAAAILGVLSRSVLAGNGTVGER